jgi:transcriptional regulator with XRE-family HTH domain
MDVGKSIKVALAKRGINQTQLSQQMGCTQVWINRLANSRTASMPTVESLAEAFGMKVSDFIKLGEE